MSSSIFLDADEVQNSLQSKSSFAGPSYNASKIVDELDALVEFGLAVQVMDSLHGTDWQPPQPPWSMSKIYSYAEKLRVSDLGEYLSFIRGLGIILQKIAIEQRLAVIPLEDSPPTTTPFKL